ncbi:MAG: amino acid ABC transporter substrate-binding protein [Desulfobacterota bacterium]|jgi:branched-chain amino acid transport system substrate-binding protein|nr:amino acid ABC transporter substrate-binding protein [Thermodesulfobacteriota bacterium]
MKGCIAGILKAGLLVLVCGCLLAPSTGLAKEVKKEILIGTNLPLTGILAMAGVEQQWAYQTAVDDVNKTGGVFVKEFGKKLPVRLIVADDESDPGKAAAAVERLIKMDKVDLLLGGFAAPFGVIPGCITAEKYKKYYHTTICLIPPWLEHKFKWSTLFFFDLVQACSVPFEIWNTLPKDQRPKKPALIMEDTFDGRAFAGIFREQAKKHGYTFALDEPWAVGAKDYSAQIIKAKSLGVDAILIFGADTDCITFVRQMKENKLNVIYFHGWKGTWAGEFWAALGKEAQYVLSDGFWSMDFPFPGARQLGERYYEKFKKYSVSIGATYGLCQILWQAIEKAGTLDSAKVRQAVLATEFQTVMGKVKYDANGVATFVSTAHQWWDGKQMTVYPFNWTKYKIKLAPPWDKR